MKFRAKIVEYRVSSLLVIHLETRKSSERLAELTPLLSGIVDVEVSRSPNQESIFMASEYSQKEETP